MLSYQHLYHAGNMADVHKHALLSWALDYMVQKDKPLTYFETHAGRGLYDLATAESVKTGEAAAGIAVAEAAGWFAPDHPFARVLAEVRADHGPTAYPGSPLVASEVLRPDDRMGLWELHPQEFAALEETMANIGAFIDKSDGLAAVMAAAPPEPARGIVLVDPSYEVKTDYEEITPWVARLHKRWRVGVVMVWYPILNDDRHLPLTDAMVAKFPDIFRHEVRFPPAREGHRMVGSGILMLNAPYGIEVEAARLSALYNALRR